MCGTFRSDVWGTGPRPGYRTRKTHRLCLVESKFPAQGLNKFMSCPPWLIQVLRPAVFFHNDSEPQQFHKSSGSRTPTPRLFKTRGLLRAGGSVKKQSAHQEYYFHHRPSCERPSTHSTPRAARHNHVVVRKSAGHNFVGTPRSKRDTAKSMNEGR